MIKSRSKYMHKYLLKGLVNNVHNLKLHRTVSVITPMQFKMPSDRFTVPDTV